MQQFFLTLVLLCLAWVPAHADSLRCSNGLIDTGMGKYEVLQKCGKPDFVDQPKQQYIQGIGFIAVNEVWYYNRGPSRLVRVLSFRNGRLSDISTEGYGYDRVPAGACDGAALHVGMSKFALLARCGEPAYRDSWIEYRAGGGGDADGDTGIGPARAVPVELWTYDLGKNRMLRHVKLVDGKVVQIRVGDQAN